MANKPTKRRPKLQPKHQPCVHERLRHLIADYTYQQTEGEEEEMCPACMLGGLVGETLAESGSISHFDEFVKHLADRITDAYHQARQHGHGHN